MASDDSGIDVRGELVRLLIGKIASDRYPSATMMTMVEGMLTPDELAAYAGVLLDKVKTEPHPSISMMQRLQALGR